MTKPILSPTEYDALCNILEFCWELLRSEPELCEQSIDYSDNYDDDGNQIDVIRTGQSGLGFSEAFEYTLDNPNAKNIMVMVSNLMYKLNCNPCLGNGFGNTWETLAPLVDNNERHHLEELSDDPDVTTQTLEGYVIESIGLKNKVARLQEHYENVNEIGYIQVDDNLWIDGGNSDLIP